ncbi:hypothetical protein Tco_1105446 [Tanacetum coccineum]
MSASNQQTLAESRASERPPMLEKGGYVPWASRFMRFLDNKQEEGERMRHSIKVGSYKQKMIQNPDKPDYPTTTIIEPPRKMTESTNTNVLLLHLKERRDEKKRLDHLKQDQTMLAIKIFSKRKKVFSERKKTGKIRAKRMVVKEIEDGLLEEIEKFGWWFEQDIDGESEDDNEKKLVMVNEEGWMIK